MRGDRDAFLHRLYGRETDQAETNLNNLTHIIDTEGKWSRNRPGVAQTVGRGKSLLFHDRGTRREWVVSSTPRPQFTPGKDPHCTGGWVVPRAGLDGRKISSSPGFDPGPSSP